MEARGFHPAGLFDVRPSDDPLPEPRPSQAEQLTAAADAACRSGSEVTARLAETETALQTEILDQHPTLVEEFLETNRELGLIS